MKVPDWIAARLREVPAADPIAYLAGNSRSFRFATRFLPGDEARRIAEVYAFCRFTDDLVDGAPVVPAEEVAERLGEWEYLARRAHAGVATGIPLLDGPLGRTGRLEVGFRYAQALIDGMRMDLAPRRYANLEELGLYAYRVAGAVGQWLTELAGVRGAWALERAADLGQAMQITNVLRDVGEDWRRGRLYLPLDVMARHGFAPDSLAEASRWGGEPPLAWRSLMEELMEVAERHYRSALQGIPCLPGYFQRPVLVAALVYREIHEALRQNGYDNIGRRAVVSPAAKIAVGCRALWLLPSLRELFPPAPASSREVAFGL